MQRRDWLALGLALLVGLVWRVLLWGHLPRTGWISDEAEYFAAASWLAQGRGFSWYSDWLWTRAPLYPLFIAAHIRLFGPHPEPVYVTQILLSLLNTALVFFLARRILPDQFHDSATYQPTRTIPLVAALFSALYLPLASYTQMLLSETLFISLTLSIWLVLATWAAIRTSITPWHSWLLLIIAGFLLGLATLTRSMALGFVPIVAAWVWLTLRRPTLSSIDKDKLQGKIDKSAHSKPLQEATPVNTTSSGSKRTLWGKDNIQPLLAGLTLIIATLLVVAPWTIYNSRIYGGLVVVDTTGAFNLLLGARTAYDGNRNDATTRRFVLAITPHDPPRTATERSSLLTGSCLVEHNDPHIQPVLQPEAITLTHAERQSIMSAEGLCLISAAPLRFLTKSLGELIDLLQINYTGSERFANGFTLGRLPEWYTLALFLLDDTLYVLVLLLALIGFGALFRLPKHERSQLHSLLGWWILYACCTVPLLFAINRFRIPLMPILGIYAALGFNTLIAVLHKRTTAYRPQRGWIIAGLVLFVLATMPPSYFGSYPASISASWKALMARSDWSISQKLAQTLRGHDADQARLLLRQTNVPTYTRALAEPLVAMLDSKPEQALELVHVAEQQGGYIESWQSSVLRGEIFRQQGNEKSARASFTPRVVDEHNPVAWAWEWLPLKPTRHIDLGGNLDLGYIDGFYLGEGDPTAQGTFRWSGQHAMLRFPEQGQAYEQEICLRVDGRAWIDQPSPASVQITIAEAGKPGSMTTLWPMPRDIREQCFSMPPMTPQSDILVTIESDTFIPSASDLLGQQGDFAGQLRQLGLRIDWVELRPSVASP